MRNLKAKNRLAGLLAASLLLSTLPLRAAVIIVDNAAEGTRRRGKWAVLERGEP